MTLPKPSEEKSQFARQTKKIPIKYILININAYLPLTVVSTMNCNHAKGFRRKQRLFKNDKRRNGPSTRADRGLLHNSGCKHPEIFPVMTVTAHYSVAQGRGSPTENKPPVYNDNGDLSNFLFYSADTPGRPYFDWYASRRPVTTSTCIIYQP